MAQSSLDYLVMAYKISKTEDAPEGTIKVAIGVKTIRVKDDAPYETDDVALIDEIRMHDSPYLVIEEADTGADPREVGKEESKLLNELHKAQDEAKEQHAEKDPMEPAAAVPTSVADLKEIKAEEATEETTEEPKKAAPKGGKK